MSHLLAKLRDVLVTHTTAAANADEFLTEDCYA